MDEQLNLDDEVAELADNLLEKRMNTTTTSAELRTLDEIVQQLEQVIRPNDPPSPTYRARLTQRLIEEWNVAHDNRRFRGYNRRLTPLMMLAALLVVVLLAALLLANPAEMPLTGTASGAGGVVIIVVLAVAVGTLVFALWQRLNR